MIQELSNALRRLVNSLSTRPLATLVAVFIICASFIAYKSYSTLEQLVVTPDQEATRFQKQLESSKLVNQSLEKLRVDLNAQSVVIKQFHNGRHDLTGIPFSEASDTYYTDTYDDVGDETISSMNGSLRKMWSRIDSPECISIDSPVDSSSKKYFKNYKLTKVVECPLTNILNYPIGLIQVGFSGDNTTKEDRDALSKTYTISKSVTGYLKNGY
jgi:hypothetical protein